MIGFPAILLTLLCWMPTTYVNTYREVAEAMRRDERDAGGVRPRYGFYAQPENLPICWAARRVIPSFFTQADVDAALASQPKPVLLSARTRPPPPVPPGYYERHRFIVDDRQIVIYAPKQ
jgi:hypothetical protein